MKKLLLSIIAISYCAAAFAGGLNHNNNQSADYVRLMSRSGSLDGDAVFYNPAGTAFFRKGFTLSLNSQTPFQTRNISCDFAPLQMGQTKGKYEGKVGTPVFPGLYAAYTMDRFSFSVGFNPIGGGGSAVFDNGLPMLETPIAALAASGMLPGVTKYEMDMRLEGSTMILGYQAGAAYRINDIFSAAVALRVASAHNTYEGYMKDIKYNIGGGAMVPFAGTPDKQLNAVQKGSGITPIVGFDIRLPKLNIGLKYEFLTKITMTNDTEVDDVDMFPDGAEVRNDLPAMLTAGAEYMLLPKLKVTGSFVYYFDKDAKFGGREVMLDKNTWELLAGVEYAVTDPLLISCGYQRAQHGVSESYQDDIGHRLASNWYGFGGSYKFSEKFRLIAGCLYAKNVKETVKQTNSLLGNPFSYNTTYNRKTVAFSVGGEFRF